MDGDTAYRPTGYHTLTPYLAVRDGARLIEFYQGAFGAEVVRRMDGPDGTVMHAELRIGDSMLQISDEMPSMGLVAPSGESRTGSVVVYVPDVDEVFTRALRLGATQVAPVSDVFSGDRMGLITCPSGHRWAILTRVREVPDAEVDRLAREMYGEAFSSSS
jgi:uncharacterized glyoxalase superfamily protein PhnB